MKKRMTALALAAAMTAGCLAGCGDNGSQNTPASNGSGSGSSGAEATENGGNAGGAGQAEDGSYPVVKLAYMMIGDSSAEAEIEEKLNVILEEKAGAHIDLVGLEFANMTTQLNLMLTGGENSIDLFNSGWYSMSSLLANGQILPLDELLASDGQGILGLYEGYEDFLSCGNVGGVQYGVPCIYAWCNQNMYLVQEQDAVDADIDWSQVNSLDDLTEAMIAMKETHPDKYFMPGSTQSYWVPKDIDSLGDANLLGVLTDPLNSTTVENYYESDYFVNFLDNVRVWKEHDIISPDPMSNGDPTLVNLQYGVTEGTTGYNWDAQVGIAGSEASYGMELVGTNLTEQLATSGDVISGMWHISQFASDPAACMRVLNVLYTDEEAAMLVGAGIEGRTYVVNDDGRLSYPEGKSLFDCGWGAANMPTWPNMTLCTPRDHEPADIYEQIAKANASTPKSLALGFQFDASPVADQTAACANVVAQYYMPLIMGEADIDSVLPEFQKALKTAGIDEIVTEKQRQLDEWLAAR